MKTKPFLWAIGILIAFRLITMAFTPIFDPSEARYAVMSANMARSGDFVVPHFTYRGVYQSFDGKPPLVFQAGGVCCKALGVNEFAVRLFPFLCAVLMGGLLFHTVRKFADADRARLSVVVYGSSAAFYATAGFAMTDVPLATCVAGALLMYRCFCDRQQFRYALAVAALLGAGMIVKGPVSFVLFGFPVFVDAIVNRRWGCIFNWKWLLALPLYLIIAVPWFVIVERQNPGAVEYFFVNENFKRFLVHEYGDKYGAGRETFRGMALIWTFLATLPWALLPIWEGVRSLVARQKGKANFERRLTFCWKDFSFIAILAVTFFWCLTSRTLVSYLLPVTPLFAAWLSMRYRQVALSRLAPWVAGIVAVGLALGLFVAPKFSDKMRGAAAPQCYGFRNRYAHEFYHGTPSECRGNHVDVRLLEAKARQAVKK